MKALILIFALCFRVVLFGQQTSGHKRSADGRLPLAKRMYGVLSAAGPGVVFLPNYSGEMHIRFPYTVENASGNQTQHTFDETFHLSFLQHTNFFLSLFMVEIGEYRSHIVFNTDFNLTGNGLHLAAGYGRNIYLGKKGSTFEQRRTSCTFLLKPSISLAMYNYSTTKIGSIDNKDVDVYVLGMHANSDIELRGVGANGTVAADHINVFYIQNELGLQPKISLATNPYKMRWHIGIFVSYFIPLRENGGLSFEQVDVEGRSHNNMQQGLAPVKLNHQGLDAAYNNLPVTSSPFHLSNTYIGVTFGINLVKRR